MFLIIYIDGRQEYGYSENDMATLDWRNIKMVINRTTPTGYQCQKCQTQQLLASNMSRTVLPPEKSMDDLAKLFCIGFGYFCYYYTKEYPPLAGLLILTTIIMYLALKTII